MLQLTNKKESVKWYTGKARLVCKDGKWREVGCCCKLLLAMLPVLTSCHSLLWLPVFISLLPFCITFLISERNHMMGMYQCMHGWTATVPRGIETGHTHTLYSISWFSINSSETWWYFIMKKIKGSPSWIIHLFSLLSQLIRDGRPFSRFSWGIFICLKD